MAARRCKSGPPRGVKSRRLRCQFQAAVFINLGVFKKRRRKYGKFTYINNSDLTPEALISYSLEFHKRTKNGHIVEGQTLLVIDECQILFNCRDWQAQGRSKWATFFTQHRKYGYNIILITQFDRLVDRQIRSLVEYNVIHRKLSNYKTIGFILGLAFRGNLFIAVREWYGVHEKCDSQIFVMKRKYAALYDSYKLFSADKPIGSSEPAAAGVTGAPAAPAPKATNDFIAIMMEAELNKI